MSEIDFELDMDELPPVRTFIDGELISIDTELNQSNERSVLSEIAPINQMSERSDISEIAPINQSNERSLLSASVFDSTDESVAHDLGISLVGSVSACFERAVSAQNVAAALVLEAGYLMLKAKSECEHGEFLKLLKAHGITQPRASDLMMTAKFYSRSTPEQRKQIFTLSKSKLRLLAGADSEVIQDLLDEPGEDLSNLSVRELRQRVRYLENAQSKQVNIIKAENENLKAINAKLQKRDSRNYVFDPKTHIVREECLVYQAECEVALNSLEALFTECLNDLVETEKAMRIEQVFITATVVAARAAEVVHKLKKHAAYFDGVELPKTITGIHTLTDDEAERWLLDYQSIERKAYAAKALREQKREEAKPKGPGRPKNG
ncbi:MAG: hypothetical protein Q7U98_20310 [Methylicorpusculum sp.]|uniref:hypothetical protein n=1 Tax=Methylicorpusculum sp. TaxID=2713644 RepID=UPI0027284B61|nr:hypothetical protein [Methylicorpusculum sp.]MDO8941509.1 hypothetical protein [Methylicorpusculum sp.]